MEQIHFATKAAVITLFSFFKHMEVGLKIVIIGECSAIDTGQHFIFLITAPVSTCDISQFYRFNESGVRDVWSATQIGKATLCIERNAAIFQTVDQFQFVRILFFGEVSDCIRFRYFFTAVTVFLTGQLFHFLLDLLQVFIRDFLIAQIDIIIETSFDRRTDSEFGIRVERL
ncbi:hypothetical protein FQZ97_981220 [compost metagenome]